MDFEALALLKRVYALEQEIEALKARLNAVEDAPSRNPAPDWYLKLVAEQNKASVPVMPKRRGRPPKVRDGN